MIKKTFFLILIVCICGPCSVIGQVFTPVTLQFNKSDYKAANQNWSAAQTTDGRLYFGNNDGLLEFDGSIWKTYRMPNSKLVRSLMVDKNDRLYAGSFEEFGFFTRDNTGNMNYTSLSAKLNGYQMLNDEIWNIFSYQGKVIFQSFTSYFVYDGKTVTGHRLGFVTMFFCVFNHTVYCHSDLLGFSLLDMKDNSIKPVVGTPFRSSVINILPYDSRRAVVVTKFDGLFLFDGKEFSPFHTSVDALLKQADINRAILTKDDIIILGTIQDGVTAIDRKGNWLWTLNNLNILQNNTVLGLFCDKNNNIWVCHDVGISMIQHSSRIRLIKSFDPMIGAVYTVFYDAPWIYIGTNQGLYVGQYSEVDNRIRNLHLQPHITGQVWDISRIDNQLICSFNDGTYELMGGNATCLSSVKGGTCIRKGVINGQEVLIQGTYSTLCVYVRSGGKWKFSHIIDNFINPVRYIEIDHTGTIWVSHLHEGIYAIQLSRDLRKAESVAEYKTLDGKTGTNLGLFMLNDWIVFSDHKQFYTYDYLKKTIIPYEELNKQTGNFAGSYRICRFKNDYFWFIRDNEAGLFELTNSRYKLVDFLTYSAFPTLTVDNNQNIVPLSDKKCLVTLENGLALYRMSERGITHIQVNLQMSSVSATNDEATQSLSLLVNNEPHLIPFKLNNLHFSVFYPDYGRMNNVEFRYKLDGLDKVWTASSLCERKYNYLPYGNYTFRAEAISKSGRKLASVSYSFTILPPLYLSFWAITFYVLLFILLICFMFWYISRYFHHKKEKIRLEHEEIRKKEIEKREKQIAALEKEVLESELKLKSKEIAESTMTIIKKNEMLQSIRKEIDEQKKLLGSQYPKKYYDRLIKLVDENLTSEDDWAVFQANFDRIHENFFRNLKIQYPQLTSNDLRFCAYLRLNLTSKDIAHLMNITLKGVEVGRYRIRKKLGVPSSKNLTEFMIEYK